MNGFPTYMRNQESPHLHKSILSSCSSLPPYFEIFGFGVSPFALALVARLAAAVIVALSFLVVTPGLLTIRGLNPPMTVALRRFV